MHTTVSNLLHQLLDPQVNNEVARVIAERMGLTQVPSPYMTIKYKQDKTGIALMRSFMQKQWHYVDTCVVTVTDTGVPAPTILDMDESSYYEENHALSEWLKTRQGEAFVAALTGFDLPALLQHIVARFGMLTTYDLCWWGGERLRGAFRDIVRVEYARALRCMAKRVVHQLRHGSLTVRYHNAYPFDLPVPDMYDLGAYLDLYNKVAQESHVKVALTPSVLCAERSSKEYLLRCEEHVFTYVDCVEPDDTLLESHFTVTWGNINQKSTYTFLEVLFSDVDFIKWLCSSLPETVALALENKCHWPRQLHTNAEIARQQGAQTGG